MLTLLCVGFVGLVEATARKEKGCEQFEQLEQSDAAHVLPHLHLVLFLMAAGMTA